MVREAPAQELPPQASSLAVDVVMPAHNEGESIGDTIREFHKIAHDLHGVDVRFVISEDGSSDDTCDVVREVARDLPVHLLSYPERKGYSRAVVDGLRETSAPLVCFVDSDGQCDPQDLPRLFAALPGYDMVIGYRHPRQDTRFRRLSSGAFKTVYRLLFPVKLRDPSCPLHRGATRGPRRDPAGSPRHPEAGVLVGVQRARGLGRRVRGSGSGSSPAAGRGGHPGLSSREDPAHRVRAHPGIVHPSEGTARAPTIGVST